MIAIDNYSKNYGVKSVIDDLTLHIKSGELYGLIGKKGAGKSTLIKSCCGLQPFDAGSIFINEISITEDPVLCKHNISYVSGNPDLYEHLTGIDYLVFVSDVFGMTVPKREANILRLAARFDMMEQLDGYIRTYSHSTKIKLAVVAAFLHEPKVVFLDEPFLGLEAVAAFELKKLMREFCNDGGTVLFSSKSLNIPEDICDHIGLLKDGGLIINGRVSDVIKDKANEELFLELED